MRPVYLCLILSALLAVLGGRAASQVKPVAPAAPAPAGAAPTKPAPASPLGANDEQLLKAAGVAPTGPGLLDFLRRRTQPPPDPTRLGQLVRALGDKDAKARDHAAAELVAIGPVAMPLLRQAANELEDAVLAERARQLLLHIDGAAALTAAAARGLAIFKPAGSTEVLLAALPLAEDDRALEDLTAALAAVAVREGKLDASLLAALDDPLPVRRAVAAEVIGQVGQVSDRQAIRKLLKDPKLDVRRRAALVLAAHQDAEAVPALVGLLAELPTDQSRAIEDYLSGLAGEWSVRAPSGNDTLARRLRRDLWAAWWDATDGPSLLEEFRKRTPPDAERQKLQALVAKLGDPQPAVRDKAMSDVLSVGAAAAPYLRQAIPNLDARGADAARKCLSLVEANGTPPLPSAAVRLLALRRPSGTAETMLAYLPSAEDESIAQELREALASVGVRDGKPDPALVKALDDSSPVRRAAAAEILTSLADHRPVVRKLLSDPVPAVRHRVAVALGAAREKEAVPVLIALLSELPLLQAGQVEDSLRALADESAPDVSLGDDAAARKKCRAAWEAWWQKNSDKVDLARLDPKTLMLGFTVVVEQYGPNGNTGRVLELDRRGKLRWQIDNLRMPIDAQVLPGERVLVCEQGTNRVKEMDFKGKVLWEKQINQPMGAQRLPNGNTFIVCRHQLVEVDRTGREVFTHSRPASDINCGRKLRNGHLVFVTYQGACIRLDANGKELRTVRVPPVNYYGGFIDMLPNDHVVAPLYNSNKVVEYDTGGRPVWEATISMPLSARRLPGGTTLVVSSNPFRVVELDRAGKIIWESKEFVQATRADRR